MTEFLCSRVPSLLTVFLAIFEDTDQMFMWELALWTPDVQEEAFLVV